MSDWDIQWTASALRDMKKLIAQDQGRIHSALEKLARDPRMADCKKMQGAPPRWRMRVGEWRVVFTLDRANRNVTVREVFNRQQGY